MPEMQATGKALLMFRGFDEVLEIEALLFLFLCPGHTDAICPFQECGALTAAANAVSVLFTVSW